MATYEFLGLFFFALALRRYTHRIPRQSLILTNKTLWTVLFIIILVVFFVLKYRVLSTPFFWDELGVYGSMAFQLADKGPSLHPKVLDQWLTHGHPLLYPFLISIVCKWFGTSVFTAHFGNLIIALGLVISVFFHVSQLKNRCVGFLAVSILISQPIFFAQSAMTLPEVALSLTLWWSTWAYFRRQLLSYFIAGSAAVLIKEPAIVWIFALFMYDFLFGKNRLSWRSVQWLLPLIAFGVFLVVQKHTWGWYLFPSHTNGFEFNPDVIISKLRRYLLFMFWDQGRVLFAVTIILSGLITMTNPGEWRAYWSKARPSFLFIGLAVCITYMFFSSLTFHLSRYILPLFPYLSLLVAVSIYRLVIHRRLCLALLLFFTCTILPVTQMKSDHFVYDTDMSYLRAIDIEKKALQFMIDNGMYQEGKFSVNMPLIYAIGDKRFGYLPDSVPAYGSNPISPKTAFAVALTPGSSLENPQNLPLELHYETYFHDIKMSVYKVLHDSLVTKE